MYYQSLQFQAVLAILWDIAGSVDRLGGAAWPARRVWGLDALSRARTAPAV